MGAAIPQIVTSDRATGAQVIDGSLKFDKSLTTQLKRTPTAPGNRRLWTWSCWFKVTNTTQPGRWLSAGTSATERTNIFYYPRTNNLGVGFYSHVSSLIGQLGSTPVLADHSGWYHLTVAFDAANGVAADRIKIYINGVFQPISYSVDISNSNHYINGDVAHYIGTGADGYPFDGSMTQCYFIDGAALGPEYFGFTDPLTNTWKPKKLEGVDLDGNTFTSRVIVHLTHTGGAVSAGVYAASIGNVTTLGSYSGDTWTATNTGWVETWDLAGADSFTLSDWSATAQDNQTWYYSNDSGFSSGVTGPNSGTIANGTYSTTVSGTKYRYLRVQNAPSATYSIIGNNTLIGKLGTNGFYLPMDGNSPIGQDQSGQGNDWTPIKFGGSVELDKATGALPILNTTQGGTQATVGVRTDSNYANLRLALPLVGGDEDVSSRINSGSTTKSITANGNAAANSQTSNFYNASFYLDGSGDNIEVQDSTELEPGTDDFCYEAWFYSSALASSTFLLFDSTQGTGVYFYTTSGSLYLYLGSSQVASDYACLANDKWTHIAFVRESGTGKIFCDGVLVGSGSKADSVAGGNLFIGSSTSGGNAFNGYIQDVRVYNGTSKYSGTTVGTQYFVPPSRFPDILPDTPSGVSGGSKLTKITDGAVSFDGTGDYLTVPYSSDFVLDGDFTIECFVYFISGSVMVDFTRVGSYTNGWQLYNQAPTFYGYSSSGNAYMTSDRPLSRGWNHLAVTRTISNNTARMFINGVQTASSTSFSHTYGNDTSNVLMVGAQSYGGPQAYFTGHISNLRIIKGTALYTSNFTPPTTPLTDVTNTKLLCCQSNTQAGAAAVSPNLAAAINDGTVWSEYVTTTQGENSRDFYYAAYPAAFLFDGDTSNPVYGAWSDDNDDSSDIIFRPPSGISVSSKLEVYAGYYDKIKVNGTTYNTGGESTNVAWVTVSDGSNFTGTLTELILENTTNANVVRASAIRIDDSTILLDPVSAAGNAVATNFNPFNTDINTVRGQESGYCTLNPLDSKTATLTENNLKAQIDSDGSRFVRGTIAVSSGKYYWEFTTVGSNNMMLGAADVTATGNYNDGNVFAYYGNGGALYGESSGKASSWGGSTLAVGDTLGVALDMDNGTIVFYKNGVLIGTAWTAMYGRTIAPYIGTGGGTGSITRCNFGQKPFKFPPPDGFQPLNAANTRPVKVISRPDQYVGVTTYTGDDQASHIIRELNFNAAPDCVWIKRSDGNAAQYQIYDTIRGGTKPLQLPATASEDTQTSGLLSFVHNGFELGASSTVNGLDGDNGNVPFNYVAWSWKAGGKDGTNDFNIDGVGFSTAGDANMGISDLNSIVYNQSKTWSGITTVQSFSGTPWDTTNIFDGNDSTSIRPTSSTNTYTGADIDDYLVKIDTLGFTDAETVEIKFGGNSDSSCRIWFNNDLSTIQDLTLGSTGSSYTINTVTPPRNLQTISISGPNASGSSFGVSIFYIKVNHKFLTNPGIDLSTLTQYPTIAPVAASVGTENGFSMIRYQGNGSTNQTIPHGLTQRPDFSVFKNMDGTSNWTVYHNKATVGIQSVFYLNTSGAVADYSGGDSEWWHELPSASVFTIGATGTAINNGTNDIMSYHWHDVPGLQKFGSYVGNGSNDGPFVETGFRPALLWIKNINTSGETWCAHDDQRDKFNPAKRRLSLDSGNPQDASQAARNKDFLSNGFKIRGTSGEHNTDGETYIYCAWAQAPTVGLHGGGANAR